MASTHSTRASWEVFLNLQLAFLYAAIITSIHLLDPRWLKRPTRHTFGLQPASYLSIVLIFTLNSTLVWLLILLRDGLVPTDEAWHTTVQVTIAGWIQIAGVVAVQGVRMGGYQLVRLYHQRRQPVTDQERRRGEFIVTEFEEDRTGVVGIARCVRCNKPTEVRVLSTCEMGPECAVFVRGLSE